MEIEGRNDDSSVVFDKELHAQLVSACGSKRVAQIITAHRQECEGLAVLWLFAWPVRSPESSGPVCFFVPSGPASLDVDLEEDVESTRMSMRIFL